MKKRYFLIISLLSLPITGSQYYLSDQPSDQPITNYYTLQQILLGTNSLGENEGTTVSSSSDGSIIATASGSGSSLVWVFMQTENTWKQDIIDYSKCTVNKFYGSSLALSLNGTILTIGNPSCNEAFLYHHTNGSWNKQIRFTKQGDFLFAYSIALSADGTILAIGCPDFKNNHSAVFIYDLSKNEEPQKILGENSFGISVSLSDDGTTIAISDIESVSVYRTSNNSSWSLQFKDHHDFITSLALNNNGTLLAVNTQTPYNESIALYTRENDLWEEQDQITATDKIGAGAFSNLALDFSSNSTLLAAGGQYDNITVGAVWLFENSNNGWLQTQKIIPPPLYTSFGAAVVVTDNGGTVIVGSPGYNDSTGAVLIYDK